MKRKYVLAAVAVFVVSIGAGLAYDAYEERQQEKIMELLAGDGDCDVCTKRHQAMSKSREKSDGEQTAQ